MGFITPEFSRSLSSSPFDLSVLTGHIIGLVVVIWLFSSPSFCCIFISSYEEVAVVLSGIFLDCSVSGIDRGSVPF